MAKLGSQSLRRLALVLWLPALAACDHSLSRRDLPAPLRETAPYTSGYPAVIPIYNQGLCTGVIVHPHAVLTAAHCLKRSGTTLAASGGARFQSTQRLLHGSGEKGDARDIGLVIFNEDLTRGEPGNILPLADRVAVGETGRLVGFGCGGRKRTGTNVIYSITDFIALLATTPPTPRRITGPINRAETCPGDSGSPLLTEGANGELRIVGILHGEVHYQGDKLSAYVNVTRPDNRDFILNGLRRFGLH